MSNAELLEARYGRKKSSARDRKLGLTLGGILAVLLVGWIISVVFFAPAKAEGVVSGFEAKDSQTALVKGMITKPVDGVAVCGIGARNGNLSIVGYSEFTFDAKERQVPFAVTIKTTELAGTGVVTECRLK